MLAAEKEGLIEITIQLAHSTEHELLRDLTSFYQDNTKIVNNGELDEIEY